MSPLRSLFLVPSRMVKAGAADSAADVFGESQGAGLQGFGSLSKSKCVGGNAISLMNMHASLTYNTGMTSLLVLLLSSSSSWRRGSPIGLFCLTFVLVAASASAAFSHPTFNYHHHNNHLHGQTTFAPPLMVPSARLLLRSGTFVFLGVHA